MQELAGAGGGGLNSQLVGDEVKLSFNIGTETNTRGYVITRRPGGSDDSAYKVVADYLTPGTAHLTCSPLVAPGPARVFASPLVAPGK